MKGLSFSFYVGLSLVGLSLATMIGWNNHISSLIAPENNLLHHVFNASFCYFLAGLGIMLPAYFSKIQIPFYRVVGIVLVSISTITLSQNVFGYDLGIDSLLMNPWLSNLSSHPGRMSDASGIALLFAGCTFLLFSFPQKKISALMAEILIIFISTLGLTTLLGYVCNLQSLNFWVNGKQMSLYAAVNCSVMALGLLSIWNRHPQFQVYYLGKEDNTIFYLNGMISVCFVFLASLVIYGLFGNTQHGIDIHEKLFLFTVFSLISGMSLLYWKILSLIQKIIVTKKDLVSVNQNLQESENRFRAAFDNAAIGMALTSPHGFCIKVNQALCTVLGLQGSDFLNVDIRNFIHPDDVSEENDAISKLADGATKTCQSEQRFFHKNGETIWILSNASLIHDNSGVPLYLIWQLQNINAEKMAEEKLRQMAYHNPLTDLANRNKLELTMHELLISNQRQQSGFAVIFIDLDNFKKINDSIGHDSGDYLLKVVANRLKSTVRDTDLVARLGGDEFVLVVTNLKNVEVVAMISQKILHNLLKPIEIKGHEIYITASIGISVYPDDGQDIQTLMRNADMALYRAKENGRNNYQFCTPEMTSKANEKMKRQCALNNALIKDEFVLYYQPKMDIKNNRISGIEALLRWKNKEFEKVATSEIISLAEESGLIILLSEWILRTACRQAKNWHEEGFKDLIVSINLSPRQFKQPAFVESLFGILSEINFPPSLLELEITENLIMQDPENTLVLLQEFKKNGMKIAIDDFGSGYSSLSYLKKFSVDKIKIDKTFIHKIPEDQNTLSIVMAMIAMAHKLGIHTLAEGIETKTQYDFLLEQDCLEMQGYYLSRPLAAKDMREFLQNNADGVVLSGETRREKESGS